MEKKTYTKPTLNTWGTVVDLTKVGLTRAGDDCNFGSVNPPGHANGCPPGTIKGRQSQGG